MKKPILIFLTFFSSVILFAQKSAVDYNDMIVDEQAKIGEKITNYSYSESPEKSVLNYNALVQQINVSIATIEKLGAWQDDDSFRQATLRLFRFYKSIIENEYKQFLAIMRKPDDQITEADFAQMDKLDMEIQQKEKKFDDDFLNAQIAFAKRWGFTLE